METQTKSQIRTHLKFSIVHRLRQLRVKNNLGSFGKGIWIDKNVQFQRFPKNISIGNNVIIKEGTRICACNKSAKIKIGKNTAIGYHNFIFASEKIYIGDNCLIAPFVYIVDSDHQTEIGKLINQQTNITEPIIIGNDVWIASNVTILKGVSIGEGAVVAANSVVNKNVSSYSIVGGSPAKVIGERN